MNKIVSFFIISSLFCAIHAGGAGAVDVSPVRLEHDLEPGKTYSGSFELSNTSQFASKVAVSAGEYRYLFGSDVTPPEDPSKKSLPSCRDWFEFEKNSYALNPGESTKVNFLIKVPQDIGTEHLCAILFDEKRTLQEISHASNAGNIAVNLIPRFSIPVYISIKDRTEINADISRVSVVPEYMKGGAGINIAIKNTGNVHIRPFGTLLILNGKKDIVKNMPIGKTLPIFPEYTETITIYCPKLPANNYTAVATIQIDKETLVQKKIDFTVNKNGEIE